MSHFFDKKARLFAKNLPGTYCLHCSRFPMRDFDPVSSQVQVSRKEDDNRRPRADFSAGLSPTQHGVLVPLLQGHDMRLVGNPRSYVGHGL